jgi:uncharacterized protein (TIGR03437 family)
LVYAYTGNAFDAATYIINRGSPNVLSMSYGVCEADAANIDPLIYRAIAQQASAEGITWLAAAGDAGPAACDVPAANPESTNGMAVMFPASIPEVTAVGGTEFAESLTDDCYWGANNSAPVYIPEQAWNDTVTFNALLAGGGGASKFFTIKPAWQVGLGTDTARDVPDVAFAASGAHDPYEVFLSGAMQATTAGGTAAATSSLAGIVALLNQSIASKSPGTAGSGDINPELYALAQGRPYVFHDITNGSNMVPCASTLTGCSATTKTFGYAAVAGYDQATGLGSFDVAQLIASWKSGQSTTTTVTVTPAVVTTASSVQVSATVIPVSGSGIPTGTVNFIVMQGTNLTLLNSMPLAASGGVATATFAPMAGQLPATADTIEAVYTGDSLFEGSSGTASASVTTASGDSAVVVTVASPVEEAPTSDGSPNWTAQILLQNLTGVPTNITKFMVAGSALGSAPMSTAGNFSTDLSGSIGYIFGGATIADTPVTGMYITNNIVPPETVTFTVSGVDPSGYAWSAVSRPVAFTGPSQAIGGIVNGALFKQVQVPVGSLNPPPDVPAAQQNVFAPGMIISVFPKPGTTLSPFMATAPTPLPSTLISNDGTLFVQAAINGTPAPIFYVSSKQINLQIPYELQAGFSATVTSLPAVLTLNIGGIVSSFSFTLQPVAPGIFSADGVWNTPVGGPATTNCQQSKALPGSMITVYYTGAGVLKAPGTMDGLPAIAATPAPASTLTLVLSGPNFQTQVISSANPGPNPGLNVTSTVGAVGITQASFMLPANLAPGQYSLSIALQGVVASAALPLVTGNTVPVWVGGSN